MSCVVYTVPPEAWPCIAGRITPAGALPWSRTASSIPANLVLCVAVLWALFGGKDLGSATTSVTVETEDGEIEKRTVSKTEFRKSTALFPLALGPGVGEDESWISYAVPEALVLDLMPDDFFAPIPFYGYESYARERGFESFAEAPLAFKRELAQRVYAGFMAIGEIDRTDDVYRLTMRLYRVGDGPLAGETTHEGTDLLALVDEMSGPVRFPGEVPGYWRLAEFHRKHGRHEDARESLERVIVLDPLRPGFARARAPGDGAGAGGSGGHRGSGGAPEERVGSVGERGQGLRAGAGGAGEAGGTAGAGLAAVGLCPRAVSASSFC